MVSDTRRRRGADRDRDVIEGFVVQRALQTLLYYLRTCRDPPTAEWLERFLELEGIADYHGLNGLRTPWRAYVEALFAEPPTTITVQSVARNRAGSRNNPYMPPKVMTLDFDIEPPRLALRLLDCALDVGAECRSDLERVAQENAALRRERVAATIVNGSEATVRANTYPALAHEPEGSSKSAFRGGTYDLLQRLATKEAIREALNDFRAAEGEVEAAACASWLARFYRARGAGFIGEAGHGIANSFLITMLCEMPAASRTGAIVDPGAVAENIMTRREALAAAWARELEHFAEDVQELRRAHVPGSLR